MPNEFGANTFTAEELEELFREDVQEETPPSNNVPQNETDDSNSSTSEDATNITQTQAFSRRLKESTEKARKDEREAIAKSLGYESYDDMQKKREQQLYSDNGLNPDDVSPIVEQIVKQRLENDPRMLELENLRNQQLREFGKKELAEITKLTNGEITDLSQLPKQVINKWAEKGSLINAYMEVEGVNLVNKIRSEQSKGSTAHMNTPASSASTGNFTQRHLTQQEKDVWKFFNPGMSDEELNSKLVDN